MARAIITLTTDFGTSSPYVAQMKGVILSLCREVDLVDIAHAIGPQNIREGALVLADTTPRFPPGTVHIAVVDPGVGTARGLIYAEIGEQRYLAPDNGLLSFLIRQKLPQRVLAIENRAYWFPKPSQTFHGRDILAPVAAHLALGTDPALLGPALDGCVMLDAALPEKSACTVRGEVLYVDSFGNLITNISRDELSGLGDMARLTIECAGRAIRGVIPAYGAAMPGELVALFDSQGRLEIAVTSGHAAGELAAGAGQAVLVTGNL
ncbi:MAG: SAM-dependent chlorinase/fluorinase [Planctomycetaceae bacterium]|nr:SAM-dependent chlorinase/fluorinase [Planctomycetaceae bacterium]